MRTQTRLLMLISLLMGLLLVNPASADLVAHWPLDGNYEDATVNGHDGTPVGDPEFVQDSVRGPALEVDGSDRVIVDDAPDLNYGASESLTLTAWALYDEALAPGGWQCVAAKGRTALGGDSSYLDTLYGFYVTGGGLWHVNAGSFQEDTISAEDGEWHHLAFVQDGDNDLGFFYVDLEEVLSGGAADCDTTGRPFVIGAAGTDTTVFEAFGGRIADVRIYNEALAGDALANTTQPLNPPELASNPSPGDGDDDILHDTALTWKSGEFAARHNVYFGASYEDVDSATTPTASGLSANSFNPGRLEFGKMYYWRVDEVNGTPDKTVFKGKVWSFRAEPYSIQIPGDTIVATASSVKDDLSYPGKTVDGSGLNADGQHSITASDMWFSFISDLDPWIQYEFDAIKMLDGLKVWNSNSAAEMAIGWGAKDVQIEYSVDGENWDVLPDATQLNRAIGLPTYDQYDEIALNGVSAKYVRFDIESNWSSIPGWGQYGVSEVQFYAIPTQARTPDPTSGSVDVLPDTVATWRAGRQADEHTLYMSDDSTAVTDGTAPSVTSNANSVDLGSLDLQLGQTYYWRVDEINDTEVPSAWAGPVWSLTTPAALIVDDFENYGNVSPDRPFQTWLDGIGYSADEFFPVPYEGNGTGVGVGHDIWTVSSPHFDGQIMETVSTSAGSKQALPLYYSNTGATASQTDRTWSTPQNWSGHGVQTLVVNFRGSGDNTGGPLFVTINGTKATYPDNADLSLPMWQQWNIDLAALGAGLDAVTSMSIGVEGTGDGLVLIDDILLYMAAPDAVVPVEPSTAGLVAWYSLENNANDVSGNGHDGIAIGDPLYVTGPAGMAMEFDGLGDQYVDLGTWSPSEGTGQLSVSLWAKWHGLSDSWQGLIGKRDSWNATDMMWQIEANIDTGVVRFERTDSAINTNNPLLPEGEWAHVAVSFDGQTARLFISGTQVEMGAFELGLDPEAAFQFGAAQVEGANPFNGALDEVRLYNRALSEGEIRYLGGDR